jgi:hypothetical protein
MGGLAIGENGQQKLTGCEVAYMCFPLYLNYLLKITTDHDLDVQYFNPIILPT